ncbi:Signal peptidase-like protein [Thermosulfurimonas dismutans]|uniref:Signal peptidase-like protein n=1 Tax=Thermosulfurimonas dismutans TaxID=999894 RepID=A0A179D195_9BACT|nr:Signal peptidase-like protein [Thermosulfurimonas dismutans]
MERLFDRSKVIFYYTAEGRIDFRELVKQLVRALRTRIKMRQIGVRNEAGLHGGLGCCGREICCAAFLKEFAPVSIKMAKEQSLPLDPNKISGLCGRLLCCLLYEYHIYEELSRSLPKIGKKLQTPVGPCRVVRYNIFRRTIVLENQEGVWPRFRSLRNSQPKRSPPSKVSEKDLYQSGLLAFKQRKFEAARKAFRQYLEKYPKGRYAANAYFWIGGNLLRRAPL